MSGEPPQVTYEYRPSFKDWVPVCTRDGEDLSPIDLGEDGGDGLHCPECLYWWPGLDYWPTETQAVNCEGAKGRPLPYDYAIQLIRDSYESELV